MLPSTYLNLTVFSFAVMYSRSDLQFFHLSLWTPSERFPDVIGSELCISSKLSMNFFLYVSVLLFSGSFFICRENVLYFSVFSPRNPNWLLHMIRLTICYFWCSDWSILCIFCSPTWPTCCNLPWKCAPVKYKKRQKAGPPIVTYTISVILLFYILDYRYYGKYHDISLRNNNDLGLGSNLELH